jgi:hypothetical protein
MGLFGDPEVRKAKAAERKAKFAEREVTRKAKYAESKSRRAAKDAERKANFAEYKAQAPGPDHVQHPEHGNYAINIGENIATAGFGTTRNLKYRWSVLVKETGEPLKTGYAFTYRDAWLAGDRWIDAMLYKRDKRQQGV